MELALGSAEADELLWADFPHVPGAEALGLNLSDPLSGIGDTDNPSEKFRFERTTGINCTSFLDFDVEVSNVSWAPEIGSWVCYRRNLFSVVATIDASLPLPSGLTAMVTAVDSDGSPVALCVSPTTRKATALGPVQPQRVEETTVVFHHLQFRNATAHNNLVNGRVNPKQKVFFLVVTFSTPHEQLVQKVSMPLVVRGGHPGRFKAAEKEADSDSPPVAISSGVSDPPLPDPYPPPLVIHGRLGINETDPQHELVVRGDIQYTGNLVKQSDKRLKENFKPVDPQDQLERIKQVKIYDYNYRAEFDASKPQERGVVAQELQEVMPEAVRETGVGGQSVLAVDRDKLQIEALGATKAVAQNLEDLEDRVDDLEAEPRTVVNVISLYAGEVKHGCFQTSPYATAVCFFLLLVCLGLFIWSLLLTANPDAFTPTSAVNTLPPPPPSYFTDDHRHGRTDDDATVYIYIPYPYPPPSPPAMWHDPATVALLVTLSASAVVAICVGWAILAFCTSRQHKRQDVEVRLPADL